MNGRAGSGVYGEAFCEVYKPQKDAAYQFGQKIRHYRLPLHSPPSQALVWLYVLARTEEKAFVKDHGSSLLLIVVYVIRKCLDG